MDLRKRLGLNVTRIRQQRNLSQEALAFEAGLHRTYVSGIERGVRNPTVRIISRLAAALRVRPAALLEDRN